MASCCRICLAAEKTLLSLQTEIELDGSKLTCLEMFSSFTGLEEPPPELATELPRKICIACFSELNNCYKFQRRAIDAFHALFKKVEDSVEVAGVDDANEDNLKSKDVLEVEEELEIFVQLADDNLKIESSSFNVIGEVPQTEEEEPNVEETLVNSVAEYTEEYLEVYDCDDKNIVDVKSNELEEHDQSQKDDEFGPVEENSQQSVDGQFICSICNKKFASRKTLRQHGRVHQDSGARRFRCGHCSKSFNYGHHLKIHEMTHTMERPFPCSVCDKQFATKDRLKNHELQHKDRFEHECPRCEATYRTKKALKMHTILKHDAAVEKFELIVCARCGKDLYSQSAASAHFKGPCGQQRVGKKSGKEPKQKQMVECIDCLGKFANRAELMDHRADVHENRSHTCDVCGKRFLQAVVLNRHMKTHTGERTFSCEQCPKSFAQLATLKNHLKSHSASQEFQCTICSKRYKFLASLRSHVRSSHAEGES